MVNLCYQDLRYKNSYSLHEALLSAVNKSIEGAGTYAFITSEGLKLLFDDDMFIKFFNQHKKFKLIVGIDEVTNTKTLQKLKELSDKYGEKFEVKVFLHKDKNSLYHPKISWFKTADNKGILIVGSGNLTASGLRKNREVFSVINLEEEQIANVKEEWLAWLEANEGSLKDIDDQEVIEKANLNNIIYRKRIVQKNENFITTEVEKIGINEGTEEENIEKEAWTIYEDNSINQTYIMEIPKASTRWNQVNFKKDAFINYFGAKLEAEEEYRVLFREVSKIGELKGIEVRPGVSVKSHNYRFELDAAKGKTYPQEGRPIGIFLKVATRMFIYIILMPEDLKYDIIKSYLNDNNQEARADRTKHYKGNLEGVKERFTDLSFMQYVKEKNDRN